MYVYSMCLASQPASWVIFIPATRPAPFEARQSREQLLAGGIIEKKNEKKKYVGFQQ